MSYQEVWDFIAQEIKEVEEYVSYNVRQVNFFLKELKDYDLIAFNSYQISEIERFISKYKGSTDYLNLLYRMRHKLLDKRRERNDKHG